MTQTAGITPFYGRVLIRLPHLSTWPLAGPARYLICTDGLTDPVDDETITALLRSHDGSRAAFELWRAAIEAGAADNVTLALVEITQPAQ
ncbi:MAG: family protein phosphatase [Pseudonocardiales bacterium]|nr:family protein phosphatase [Pseudonocardiales bacterium]